MLIQIHMIQNHSPANLNRDDLGAPKTCFFGGVLRSRISSQCLKRSIRMSKEFQQLLGGVRTRRLAKLVTGKESDSKEFVRAMRILKLCGIAPKEKSGKSEDYEIKDRSAGLVYVSREAIERMVNLLSMNKPDGETARQFAETIQKHTHVPDMALFGRMLEPKKLQKSSNDKSKGAAADGDVEDGGSTTDGKVWKNLDATVEASLQVAHAISTHEARPEVDYYVAADDVPGEDAGAGYVDEAMFASACFYKYFSINWETLVKNLKNDRDDHERLAAHTVGAFLRGAALTNPTGKQNSFAAHNPPDAILVEINTTPISYANAFADPVAKGHRDIVSQSIGQLGQYVHDIEEGYGKPRKRFWFSPNLRHPLSIVEGSKETALAESNNRSLEELISAVVREIGFDWEEVRKVAVNQETAS